MRSIAIIGDVHGKFDEYYQQLKYYGAKESIQVGDMGVGFSKDHDNVLEEYYGYLGYLPESNHRFFRGNHDNPEVCQKNPNYMGDFGYDEETGIFWIAGAWSIDYQWRTAGQDWWVNEELADWQWADVRELYMETKPNIVLSHDCPLDLYPTMLGYYGKRIIPTKTSRELNGLFFDHKPKKWIFGHHHMSIVHEEEGCEFRCLSELEVYELRIEDGKENS